MVTKNQKKQTLVPELRFPEFLGQSLREVCLGDVTEESKLRNGDRHTAVSVMGVSKTDGIIPMEARLISSDIARYKRVQKNWFAYNPMRLNIGSIAQWRGSNEILVSPDYVVFKCHAEGSSGIEPAYFDHFRQTNTWEKFVTEGGDGGVRIRIYYRDIARLRLILPSLLEQQKIADCLGSLDDLICAHSRKLCALQDHKKGLLQQLFPADGETTPKLRFPEFKSKLSPVTFPDLCEIKIGLTHKPDYTESGVPFLSSKNISNGYIDFENIKFISEEKFASMPQSTKPKRGDILFTRVGSNLGNPIIFEEDKEFGIFVSLGIIRAKKGVSNYYLKQWMDSDYFWGQVNQKVAGGAKDNLNTTWLKEFRLSVPSFAEQQKIADCLSDLDALITAQAEQIVVLKKHKKGLMQQLFPSETK